MRILTLTTSALALGLAACASPTPYEAAGLNDSTGYDSNQLNTDTYRVSFEGNEVTDRETVETYLVYKAAQKTKESGHDYFRFVQRDTDQQIDVDTYQTYNATPGLYGYGAGLGYGGYSYPYYSTYGYGGAGYGTGYTDTRVTTDDSYEAMGIIEVYETMPVGMNDVLDADQVIARLRDEVRMPGEDSAGMF
jgi:hypothetical protein